MEGKQEGLAYTPIDDIPDLVSQLRHTFNTHNTFDVTFRKEQLAAVVRMLWENEEEITAAMVKDFKNKYECGLEFGGIYSSAMLMINNIDEWTKLQPLQKPIINALDGLYYRNDPLGVVLIIAPWNYPLLLTMEPLLGAIAAGCCAVVKPSEVTPNTAAVFAKYFPQYLDRSAYALVNGAVDETTILLQQRWDHIFYTGNSFVGRIVMRAAVENLTPVTLELGGKSPAIVLKSANIQVAANRIASGKLLNCGQTCIAPDYILVDSSVKSELIQCICKFFEERIGDDPLSSGSYCQISHTRHVQRLKKLLDSSKGKIEYGGKIEADARIIHPTVLTDVPENDSLMSEEIFGPILPILEIQDHNDAISFINRRDKPLALYIFGEDKNTINCIIAETSSGGVAINDTLVQFATHTLPFGGVGESGLGSYHGKKTFEIFTHKKSILWKSSGMEFVYQKIRYPPYTKETMSRFRKIVYGSPSSQVLNKSFDWSKHSGTSRSKSLKMIGFIVVISILLKILL